VNQEENKGNIKCNTCKKIIYFNREASFMKCSRYPEGHSSLYVSLCQQYEKQEFEVVHILQVKIESWLKWSYETFGKTEYMHISKAYHLKEEVDELIKSFKMMEDPGEEIADCFILLMTAAFHYGYDLEKIVNECDKKFEILKKRDWNKPDENGVVRHKK